MSYQYELGFEVGDLCMHTQLCKASLWPVSPPPFDPLLRLCGSKEGQRILWGDRGPLRAS